MSRDKRSDQTMEQPHIFRAENDSTDVRDPAACFNSKTLRIVFNPAPVYPYATVGKIDSNRGGDWTGERGAARARDRQRGRKGAPRRRRRGKSHRVPATARTLPPGVVSQVAAAFHTCRAPARALVSSSTRLCRLPRMVGVLPQVVAAAAVAFRPTATARACQIFGCRETRA